MHLPAPSRARAYKTASQPHPNVQMENITSSLKPHPDGAGGFAMHLPATHGNPIGWVAVEDIGKVAVAVIAEVRAGSRVGGARVHYLAGIV